MVWGEHRVSMDDALRRSAVANLSTEQLDIFDHACMNERGLVAIVACAGAGKTRLLSYLMCLAMFKRFTIYLGTSTRASKDAALARVDALGKPFDLSFPHENARTFHALALRHAKLKHGSGVTLVGKTRLIEMLTAIIETEVHLHETRKDPPSSELCLASPPTDAAAVLYGLRVEQLRSMLAVDGSVYGEIASVALKALTAAMERDEESGHRLSDFDEMICEYATDGQSPGERGDVLFVDEFQDSALSQLVIVKSAIEKGVAVVVLGDDSQSIFGFAGATFNTIQSTIKWASMSLVRMQHFKLLRNHRSTDAVVAASEMLLPSDDRAARIGVVGNGEKGGGGVHVSDTSDATVSTEIVKLFKADTPPEHIVVLRHRNWKNDDPIVVNLRKAGVPIHVVGAPLTITMSERVLAIVQVCTGLEAYVDDIDEKMSVVQTFLRSIRGAPGCPPLAVAAMKTTLERSMCDVDVLLTEKHAEIMREYEAAMMANADDPSTAPKRQKTTEGGGKRSANMLATLAAAAHVVKAVRRNIERVEKGTPPVVIAPLGKKAQQSSISITWEPTDLTTAKLTGKLAWTIIRDVLSCSSSKLTNAGAVCDEIRQLVGALSIDIVDDYAIDIRSAVTRTLVELHDTSIADKLILSTIHRFKGHERPIAFVTDLREPWSRPDHVKLASLSPYHDTGCKNRLGLGTCGCTRFASKKEAHDRATEAEAMRLMYVGASRAKERLFLSSFDPARPLQALTEMVKTNKAERFG